MGGTDEFWSFAQSLLDDEEAEDEKSVVPSNESTDVAMSSAGTNAITYRSGVGSPGVVVAVVFVGFLLLSSVVAFLLWNTSDENPNDLDGDGIKNEMDDCFDGFDEWTFDQTLDHDRDGCHDGEEDDDDDNDTVPDEADACPTGGINWVPTAEIDNDADGCMDFIEDTDDDNDNVSDELDAFPLDASEWQDTDGDGVGDNGDAFPNDPTEQVDSDGDGWGDNSDLFPTNETEWADADRDGTGDNADVDDDNDGVLDVQDMNPGKDVGVVIQLETFTLFDNVDWFSDQGDMYFCIAINNGSEVCQYGTGNLQVTVGEPASINVSHYHNLDESLRYHSIQLSVYDWDPIVDDKIDIHPDANMLDFTVVYDSVSPSEYLSFTTNGSGDGDAGLLEFSLLPFDYLGMTNIDYNWMFNGDLQSLTVVSTYADYLMYRNMNHAIDWSNANSHADVISQYAAFATPEDPTIMGLADNLSQMATQHGYTSDLDVLRYIYAFVGLIPYAYDIDSTNYTEYPKYPVEMIYDQRGDCEDSSALFISLVEHLGYDAGLMLGTVKATEDDEWGGHAWPVVALENHSGWSVNGVGQKANLSYYFVESTAYYEGSSDIGINPWYDMANETFYDVGA